MFRSPRAALAPLVLVMFSLFAASAQAAPPPEPMISGTPTEGQTLTTSNGLWPQLYPPFITYSYQWQLCDADGNACENIPGETSNQHVLSAADVGNRLRAFVTANDGELTQSQTSAATEVIAPDAPPTPTPPIVTGSAVDGQTLSATEGTWTEPNSGLTFTYQWWRCNADQVYDCSEISGATSSTVLLTPSEVSFKIKVVVTADNGEGTADQTSALTGPVNALAPAAQGSPTITGDLINGSTVTADPGTWTGTPVITFEFQWYRCDSDGAGCVLIDGANGSTYVITGAEVGGTLLYGIAGSNQGGITGVFSAVSGVVENMMLPTLEGSPEVTGETVEGSTLTTSNGIWFGGEPISFTYQWRRCNLAGNVCGDIVGANDQTYLITSQDVGHTLTARVIASNAGGTDNATAQPPVGPVVGLPDPLPDPVPDPLPEPPAGPPIELAPEKFAVEVKTPSQSMERAEFLFSLPAAGRGTFAGTVVDDTRHVGAEDTRRTPEGTRYTAFSRKFSASKPGNLELPATLSPRALDTIRQRGFLRVTLTTKFTPAGSQTTQVYKRIVKLRPFAIAAFGTSEDDTTATATLRTPRSGRLAVKFILRDRRTGDSQTIRAFAPRELAGGSYSYSAPLTVAARRAITNGNARLLVKAELETSLYSARMLRSRYIRISN